MFTLDCDRAYLYAHPERELTRRRNAALRRSSRPPRYRRAGAVHHGASGILGAGFNCVAGGADSSSGDGACGGGGAGTLSRADSKQIQDQGRAADRAVCATRAAHRRCGHWFGSDCAGSGQRAAVGARSMRPTFPPKRWKSLGPMRRGLNLLRASSFTGRICSADFRRLRSTLWFRILLMSAIRRKIRCSWKCASSSRAMRCLPGRRAWK